MVEEPNMHVFPHPLSTEDHCHPGFDRLVVAGHSHLAWHRFDSRHAQHPWHCRFTWSGDTEQEQAEAPGGRSTSRSPL